MSTSTTTTAFQAMVERYERCGWHVRIIDHTALRAIIRTEACDHYNDQGELMLTVPDRLPACRKVWVDSQGEVHQTDVPC